jgi:fibronectin-binding autotransporter adhesin
VIRLRIATGLVVAAVAGMLLPAAGQAATAPCTVSWTGGASGDWDTPGNWTGDHVPVAGADVCIETASVVSLSQGDTQAAAVASLDIGGNSGAAAELQLAIGQVVTSTATTIGSHASLVLNGTYTSGEAGNAALGGGTVDNLGTITLEGAGYTATLFGTVTNQGTIDIPDGTVDLGQGSNGGTGSLTNEGTIDVSPASADPTNPATVDDGGFPIVNAGGTIDNQGTFNIGASNGIDAGYTQGNGTVTGNALQIYGGTPIVYTGTGASSLNVVDSNSLTGSLVAGQSLQANIGVVLSTTASMTNAGSITLNGSYHGSGGGNAALNGAAGTTITNTGTLTLEDNATLSGTVVNTGTISVPDGTAVLGSGSNGPSAAPIGTLTNDGTIDIAATSSDTNNPPTLQSAGMPVSDNGGTIDNQGTFTVGGANGVASGYAQGNGTETGNPVEIYGDAPIAFTGKGAASIEAHDTGTLSGSLSAGQTLQTDIGVTLTAPSSFTNAGTIVLNDTYYGSGGGSSGITLTSGTFTNAGSLVSEQGTTLAGDVDNTGTITLEPGATLEETSGKFSTTGTIITQISSQAFGELQIDSGASLALGGTLDPTLEGGFTPTQEIDVIKSPGWTGTFASVAKNWKPDYNTSGNYVGIIYDPGYTGPVAGTPPTVRKVAGGAGKVTVTLTCALKTGSCESYSIVITARAKKTAKPETIALLRGTVKAGKSVKASVSLNAAGRKLLAKLKKLRATVTIGAGTTLLKSATVTISKPKPKARRG